MANISKAGLNARQLAAAMMLFQGKDKDEIAKACFPCLSADGMTYDEKKVKQARQNLNRWINDPKFQEYYQKLLKDFAMRWYGKALHTIAGQMDSTQGWLANKAANDMLTRIGNLVTGDEENTVKIKIEGMPTLGSPDQAENVEDVEDK